MPSTRLGQYTRRKSIHPEVVRRQRITNESYTSDSSESSQDDAAFAERDQDDDAPAEDAEITEGGWICRVERFGNVKDVDSRGQINYHRPQKKKPSPFVHQDLKKAPKREIRDHEVTQSIISYFQRTRRRVSRIPKQPTELEIYIEIKSPLILEVLRRNATYGLESLRGNKVTIHEPYQILWHQYHALETYSKEQSNPKDCRTHITVLLKFLRACDMPNVEELVALCNPQNIVRSISFTNSWFLFTPGILIVEQAPDISHRRAFLVDEVQPAIRNLDVDGRFVYGSLLLTCHSIVYHGDFLQYHPCTARIEPFKGVVSLSQLEFIPLSLSEEPERMRCCLISRGHNFCDLRGQHMKEFVDSPCTDRSLIENERVMVDCAMFLQQQQQRYSRQRDLHRKDAEPYMDAKPFIGQHEREERYMALGNDSTAGITNDYQATAGKGLPRTPRHPDSPPVRIEILSDEVLILCNFLVWGFSFRYKQWRQYHVDHLIDVDFHKKSFDRLVLREDYKSILKAMVAQHFKQVQNRFHDLVAGKGQGLNILLHGPPGVGKTHAAECIADLYERPLYSVTSGDIGTDPEAIEFKLHQIFNLAVRWNAVLLLDEADVFLAERNLEDFSRNALVAVFLRNIEYFNGLFFLTTNRVGTLDEAFQSRLHITLGLDPLSVDDRRKIWYHFIRDLKHLSKDDRRVLARHAREEWSHKDFNGRQIRNSVKTALTLARQEGEEVQAGHFERVLDIGARFAGYMQRLKKMDRERLAEAIGTRLDLRANTFQNPETSTISRTSSKRKSEEEGATKTMENNGIELDWE